MRHGDRQSARQQLCLGTLAISAVRGLRGCHTQGRTVDEARRRILEAMELFVDNSRSAKIVDDVKLPAAVKKAIHTYTTLRKRADLEDREQSEPCVEDS